MRDPSLVAVVPKKNAERLRKHLRLARLLDSGRKIVVRGATVLIPISRHPGNLTEFAAEVAEDTGLRERETRSTPFQLITDAVAVEPRLKRFLPDKWEMIGDVLVLKLPRELDDCKVAVAEGYARVLGAKAVLQDVAGIEGDWRVPQVEKIWGGSTETVHLADGVRFKLDAAKVMFSSGNLPERMRMARISRPGETVVDMFSGIGYFAIPMAVHSRPERIYACEVNPVAFHYLEENARINRVEDLTPLLGDCRETAPEGVADRIIMGYLRAQGFLDKAMMIAGPEAVLHYHEACPNELIGTRPWSTVREAAEKAGRSIEQLHLQRLKSYAPGVSHIVLDARVSR
jgi:tRNA wybutosine-synthesizing protein 2